MTPLPIRVAQIGTGHAHAPGKMKALRRLNQYFEVAGVAECDPELRRRAEGNEAYQGLQWLSEDELLASPDVRIIAVETQVLDLVPTAARCIQAGKHVHLDKSPGASLEAFKELLDEAAKRSLTVQMGYMYRYNPAFQFLFGAVRDGWLGTVFEVHGTIGKVADESLRRELLDFPGGAMFELGCHLIDPLTILLGVPERIVPFIRASRPEQDGLADNMLAVFEFQNATATIRSSLVEVEGASRRQFVVCGDKGTVEIRPHEPPGLLLSLAEPKGGYEAGVQRVELPSMPGRYDDQLIDLALHVAGERENEYTYQHDLDVHHALLQACAIAVK